jgi:release factor glutamine methyltransferase
MIINTPDWDLSSVNNGSDSDGFGMTASTVYEPAEDTFLMLDALQLDLEYMIRSRLHYATSASIKCGPLLVVELGSGTGLLTAAVAKALHEDDKSATVGAHCIAVDLNPAACHTTVQTCKLNKVQIDVIQGDLLTWMRCPKSMGSKHVDMYGPVDVLLFNPPYVRGPDGEPAPVPMAYKDSVAQNQFVSIMTDAAWLGGGSDGVDVLKRALHQAADLLSERGVFYVLMINYNYAALVKDEMLARQERVTNNHIEYEESSPDILILTTFGSNPINRPLACRRLLSRRVPGELLAVYRIYRPHISDVNTNTNVVI